MELHCSLLSSLLADVDEERRLTVFDAGPALPETVEFFSQFKCRLYFADLYDEDVLSQQDGDASDSDMNLSDRFTTLFDYPAHTKFDVCLFWDVLSYMNEPALRAFSQALNPFLSSNTDIHGFSTLKASTKLPNQLFAIEQLDRLRVRPREGRQAPCYPHPQVELNKLLYGIGVRKATLLSNGLLEMLLKVTDSPAPVTR
ncbi:MAG: hypothetical protein DRR42_16010 [Gammaproteobacteria bacterium]|nr:MAG: hypothetical protein DRR42_16010 [Gammaproteobacteria bacterium]